MGCGDSNLIGLSFCKLRKIYALCENFIYAGRSSVLSCLGLMKLTGLTGLMGLVRLTAFKIPREMEEIIVLTSHKSKFMLS